jgi:UPF0755 protein
MSPRQLAEELQTAAAASTVLTVPEGYRREQIAELIEGLEVEYGAQAFLLATETWPAAGAAELGPPAGATLEGYLFPDTYRVDPQGPRGCGIDVEN